MLSWSAVLAAAAAGLLLRIFAAQGGLWTDEAWSVVYAEQARDPLGVFLRINHDNNHHLISLWLQLVGMDAPPWLARLPAIIAGTACVVGAALLAGTRSRAAGVVAALLFAVSPAMVALGSEARGYALMLLAALVMLIILTRAVEQGWTRATPWWLALVASLGMLSHMTMAAPVGLAALWVYLDRREAEGAKMAIRTTARLMGPAVGACVAIVAFVFVAAWASPTGMRLGGYVPFAWSDYARALDQLSGWAIGLSALPLWLRLLAIGGVAAALLYRPPRWLGSRGRLYALLIVGIPLGMLLLRPGNAVFARYYMTCLVGLFVLIGALAGRALEGRGPIRWAVIALLAIIVGLNLVGDAELIRLQRGRPDGALADIARLSPGGARVSVNRRYEAVITVAATRAGYAFRFARGCEPADFQFEPRPSDRPVPASIVRCGVAMHLVDSSVTTPMTGDAWVLYAAENLQSGRPPVSGPPPGA